MCGSIDFGLVDQVAILAVPQCTPDLLHSVSILWLFSLLLLSFSPCILVSVDPFFVAVLSSLPFLF